ncbi:MAG: helix-turn-helix domain-containing protein [Candidatus Acidiferrales bacterium]|jgi:excisionase family DNA binding protein
MRTVMVAGVSMVSPREVMNIKEASDYLGISPDTLYRYVYNDRIPAFKLGNRWKFKKAILDRWIERKIVQGKNRRRRAKG